MYALLKQCHEPTMEERFIWAHMPLPGEILPRACTMPGCTFAHNRTTAAQEHAELLAEEALLSNVNTKSDTGSILKVAHGARARAQ